MTDPTIEIADLVKTFGRVRALDGLTMTVDAGQVHGFLGPNGAGKSTTIRILLGLLRSDSGSVRVLGGDPWREAPQLHRRLAYVPGDVSLWPNLTGGEAIDLLCRARRSLDRRRREALVERFNLDPRKKGRAYSKGNRQKVALIAALASDVELLFLDEPTSGLDPLMERVFREIIREEQQQGRTVLLSSHILSEVEALCDRVTIIKDGRVVEDGSLADLRHLHRTRVTAMMSRGAAHGFEHAVGVHDAAYSNGRWSAQIDESEMPAVLARLADEGAVGITAMPPTLEELFLSHYEKA